MPISRAVPTEPGQPRWGNGRIQRAFSARASISDPGYSRRGSCRAGPGRPELRDGGRAVCIPAAGPPALLLEYKGSPGPAFCPLPGVRVLPPFPGDAVSSQGQPARPLKAKNPVLGVSVLLPTHTPHTPSARSSWRPHTRDQKLRPDPGRTAPERTFAKKSIAALVQTSPKGV